MRPRYTRRMPDESFDVAVIGSGPGGHGAAIQAAKLGRKVAVIESRATPGGNCVSTGTIPSKTLREAVAYFTGLQQRELSGVNFSLKKDVSVQDLVLRTDHVVKTETEVFRDQFLRNGVTVITGTGSFVDAHRLRVEAGHEVRELQAETIVIAVGTAPSRPADIPFDGQSVVDSDTIFHLPRIPRTMIVVGGGAIGVEYACMFSVLGTEIVMVDQRPTILEFLDREVLEALRYHMRERGAIFRLGERVTGIAREGAGVVATTASNKRIRGDVLLYSVGRLGATAGLRLEAVGIQPDDRGRLATGQFFQTAVPNIYAVGDVVGFPALAATSWEQGRIAIRHALGVGDDRMSPLLPYGLYTIPEISMVGQTEEQLTACNCPYEVGLAHYRETARGQIIGDTAGMLKLLVHSTTRQVLGVHIIGESATELVHIGQLVIGFKGTLDHLVDNTFNYPTLAECYRVAALDAANKLG